MNINKNLAIAVKKINLENLARQQKINQENTIITISGPAAVIDTTIMNGKNSNNSKSTSKKSTITTFPILAVPKKGMDTKEMTLESLKNVIFVIVRGD